MVAPLITRSASSATAGQRQSLKRSRGHADEYTAMLVRDWLEQSALRTTLHAFDEEWARLDREALGVSEWSRLVKLLEPICLARRDSVAVKTRAATPLLRLVVESLIKEEVSIPTTSSALQLPPQQSTIIMTKRSAMRDSIRIPNQQQLPRTTSSETARRTSPIGHTKTSVGSPSSLRPKSAMVCNSMADLIVRTSDGCGARSQTDEPPSTTRLKNPPRPISAASALVSRSGKSLPNRVPLHSSADTIESQTDQMPSAASLNSFVLPSTRHPSTVSAGALPHISEANDLIAGDDCDNGHPQDTVPALFLEEMSEELLMSQFSSLSKEAIKTIRRVRAKSNAYNQEFEKAKRTIDKIQMREKQRQARRLLAAEQTELLSSAMDGLTNEPCALCQHVFPKKSLVMKVTYKAIFDLRASWVAAANNAEKQHSPETNTTPDTPLAETPTNGDQEGRSQIAHFYDEAPICVFCKQFVMHVSLYRPSSAEMRAKRAEAAKAAAEAHELRESERLQALNRCDPLDFHSYQLNSDEDDSDTEEVLEYGADGRQRIVRRKRRHKAKVVANRGLVAKHLHYDKMRSESVHALNNKEWQQITS